MPWNRWLVAGLSALRAKFNLRAVLVRCFCGKGDTEINFPSVLRLSPVTLILSVLYTLRSKSFRTDFFFKSKTHTWLLRGRTVSDDLPKIHLLEILNSLVTASWISTTSAK